MKLTLGFSPCPNDTFIFDALIHGKIDTQGIEFDVHLEDVETLNQSALKGEYDISKLSYHAYGHVMSNYILLNSGSALGEGCGPLLIAASELEETIIPQLSVAIPGELTTANYLFSLEFPGTVDKRIMPFDKIESAVVNGEVDAGVIIHENRFTYADKGLVKICDLGDRWESRTNYPIPLGGIAILRDLDSETIALVDRFIRESVQYAFAYPNESRDFIKLHAQEMADDVIDQHIHLYVNHFSEDLGEHGRSAVDFMLQRASDEGLIGTLNRPLIV